MKKIFNYLLISFLPIMSACSCSDKLSFEDELKTKLENLSSVAEVNKFEMKNKSFKCGYELYFNVPLDWDNVAGEKIKQRVVVDAKAFDLPTVVELQGYSIGDKYIAEGFTRELPTLFDSNFVVIEHRFFSKSSYSKAGYEDAQGWEQLTVANAANDHAFIIGELRKVFTNKFVATGHSKGGYITNCLACMHPTICDLYIPFVAPCLTQYDSRPSEFINNEAGDSTYGKEEGKRIRDNILKFQVFCYEHKDVLIPILFSEEHCPSTNKFREKLTQENLFDINMLDFSYGLWQYGYVPLTDIDNFLALPESNKEEFDLKVKEAIRIILANGSGMDCVAYNTATYPYFITAYKEMGNYTNNFSYVRAMAESLGKNIHISIDEGKEIEMTNYCYLSQDQLDNIKYDSSMYNTLTTWIRSETLDTRIIMINGQEDPWFHGSLPLPKKLGKNIKVYTHPTSNHRVQITSFPEETKNEILSFIYESLDINK